MTKKMFLSLALVALTAVPSQAATSGFEDTVQVCKTGKTTMTKTQCDMFFQMHVAILKVNTLVENGEFAKLPKPAQDAMRALVHALIATTPVMADNRK